ncbi:hypothetical protein KFK09_024687 [Dendrobium nobile]|uniref:G protein gamma domain-containing protein n=1 Tax=Dendrobium nobile TaxID=94219 RepID=A0A8T3AEI3_DENNO|nr:hypothetical protein KFK09_024687 [Dendrobium nobile]
MEGAAQVAVKTAPSPKSPPKYPDFCGRRRLQLEVQILNREIGFLEEELQSLEGLQTVSRSCKEVEEFVGSKSDPLVPIDKKQQRSCRLWKWLRSVFCFPISLLCCSCCQKRTYCSCCSHCKYQCPRCCTCCECPCLQCKCAACPCFSNCSCFQSCHNITASCCGSCSCSCCHLPSCRIPRCSSCTCDCSFSFCRIPRCCSCSPEISCCRTPQCPACDLSFCLPWRWRCCCCCCFQELSCSLPRPSCPDYSCGCIWSCPKCTEARLCRSCCSSKSSCVTGCLC